MENDKVKKTKKSRREMTYTSHRRNDETDHAKKRRSSPERQSSGSNMEAQSSRVNKQKAAVKEKKAASAEKKSPARERIALPEGAISVNETLARDQRRKERQAAAARRRKRQLVIHLMLFAAVLIATVIGISRLVSYLNQRKLEPEGGAGTTILQAAEDAVEGSGTSGDPTEDGETEDGPGISDSASGDAAGLQNQDSDQQTSAYPENSITLCMVGDVILHQRILDASAAAEGYDFNGLFANTASEIQKYDIKIVNQETIMGGSDLGYSGYPAFNTPYEEADALVNAGFNVILQASNHALDKGQAGVQNCLHYWNTVYPDIAVLGIHDENEFSRQMFIYEKNDIRIAVLNYTYGTNQYQEEVISGQLSDVVSFWDSAQVQADILEAQEQADYVIVCPHWGEENTSDISAEQIEWTELFLDCGVDLVIGTHPHVLQQVETLKREDGKEMLVYYSLGNFVSNQEEKHGNVGAMAQVVIAKDESGDVYTADYGIRPLVTHEGYDGDSFTTYFLDEYTEEMASQNDVRATDPEFAYSYCYSHAEEIIGDLKQLTIN